MPTFVIIFDYSSAAWARMLKVTDDRVSAISTVMDHFHGSLIGAYWEVRTASAWIIANLPDSVTAAAVITAATKTGAFKGIQVHEVLNQHQFIDMKALAQSADGVYRPPGLDAVASEVQ
ncbi:MAG TPA: GYD domain-containing protein [Streptosporangiaceae bacterium]|nr:GYD domain-containing protein [Streptosporangiaceae bacterium]HYK69107.1 GYD domain-containing protein [Streptosporangiaceae bacterium]